VEGMQWMCAHILNSDLRMYHFTVSNSVQCPHTGVVAKKKIRINFTNFDVAIKEKHGIDLLGWLEGVPFQSPRAITNVESLWALRDALKDGTCRWAYMTRQQCVQFQEQLVERQTAGEVVGKPHKKHSDVGRKRCCTESAKGKPSKSATFIDSSDEENEEDD